MVIDLLKIPRLVFKITHFAEISIKLIAFSQILAEIKLSFDLRVDKLGGW